MKKIYKKLLFDLDNTLVDDDENRRCAVKHLLKERNEIIDDNRINEFIKIDDEYWQDRASGNIKVPNTLKLEEEILEWDRAQRFIRYFKDISYEEGVILNKKYIKYLSQNIVSIPNAYNVIKYLNEKEYDIYIITNGPQKLIADKLKAINVQDYVTGVFSAEEAGNMKPSKEFFDKLFNKLQYYDKTDMLIIGDDLDKDILGGVQNNIDSCWFNMKEFKNNKNYEPVYEIKDLTELKKIL